MRRSRHDSGVLVLRPEGPSLDAGSSRGLKNALREQIDAGEHELCVDLDDVESMDSTGLGVLIGAFRQLGGRGTIRLVGVRPMVRTLLDMTQLTRMFPIFEDLDGGPATPSGGTVGRPGGGTDPAPPDSKAPDTDPRAGNPEGRTNLPD